MFVFGGGGEGLKGKDALNVNEHNKFYDSFISCVATQCLAFALHENFRPPGIEAKQKRKGFRGIRTFGIMRGKSNAALL